MLDRRRIAEIAEKIARARLGRSVPLRALVEPTTDSEGNEALRVTVVLRPETVGTVSGDAALDLLVALQRALHSEGDERFPIVEYATEEELNLHDE